MFKTLSRKLRSLRTFKPAPLDLARIKNATPEQAKLVARYIEQVHAETGKVHDYDLLACAHRLMAPPAFPDAIAWASAIGPAGQAQAIEATRQLINSTDI